MKKFIFRHSKKIFYLIGWNTVILLATFPRLVLEGDISCLHNEGSNSDYLIRFTLPVIMLIVGYLFDTAYNIAITEPAFTRMKNIVIWIFLALAFILSGLVFTMYITEPCGQIICFTITWIMLFILKGVSLFIGDKETINVIKAV